MNTLLVIAARGGSKGLKNKNLLKLNKKSMTFITLEKLQKSKVFKKIILTSDSLKILKEANYFPNVIKLKRPKYLSIDKANIYKVVMHAVEFLKNSNKWSPDIILLTSPNTPLKTLSHFKRCIDILKNKNFNSALTIREPDYPTYWSLRKKKEIVKNIFVNGNKYLRRQDTPKTYQPAGTVYAFKLKVLKKLINNKKTLPLSKTAGVIVSKKEAINIDSLEEFKLTQMYLKR